MSIEYGKILPPPQIVRVEATGNLEESITTLGRVAYGGQVALMQGVDVRPEELTEAASLLGEIFEPIALPPDKTLGRTTAINAVGQVTSATNWHFDQSFAPDPPDWSLLHCTLPGDAAAPTIFGDTAVLLSMLNEDTVRALNKSKAIHRAYYPEAGQTEEAAVVSAEHDCIIDVEGNVGGLFIASATVSQIEGWTPEASQEFIRFTSKLLNRSELSLRHIWEQYDLVLWPNRRFAHRARSTVTNSPRNLTRRLGYWRNRLTPA